MLWSLVVVVAVSPGILAAILPLSLSYYFIQVSCGAGVMAVQRSLRLTCSVVFHNCLIIWHACICAGQYDWAAPYSYCTACPAALQTRYIRSSREIKRLDSLALSPIFGHFGETLQARTYT